MSIRSVASSTNTVDTATQVYKMVRDQEKQTKGRSLSPIPDIRSQDVTVLPIPRVSPPRLNKNVTALPITTSPAARQSTYTALPTSANVKAWLDQPVTAPVVHRKRSTDSYYTTSVVGESVKIDPAPKALQVESVNGNKYNLQVSEVMKMLDDASPGSNVYIVVVDKNNESSGRLNSANPTAYMMRAEIDKIKNTNETSGWKRMKDAKLRMNKRG